MRALPARNIFGCSFHLVLSSMQKKEGNLYACMKLVGTAAEEGTHGMMWNRVKKLRD